MISTKTGSNLLRWQGAMKDKAFDPLRQRKLIETTAEHFLAVLKAGTISTNVYLRRIHNYAVNMHWLPWPVLPKPNWPAVQHGEKRAITFEEHQKIINREFNPATRAYYELLWHLGGAQTDVATLTAEDINWNDRTIAYRRHKTGVTSLISFGDEVAAILEKLAKIRRFVPCPGETARTPPRQNVHQTAGNSRHQRCFASFLPLRLGRTGDGGGLSRTLCDASPRP